MNFEIYAYWNTVELAGVFNAVAAITNSGDFNGLLRTVTLIMILSLTLVVLAGRGRLEDFWKWTIMVAVFNGILLVPKSNVIIVDRVGTAPTQTIANVPIGLASVAHTVSKIGDWLTTSFEAVFALPNDLRFRTNGTLFGHRVQAEKLTLRITNQIVGNNFVEFYRECVMPELALNAITIEMVTKTNNLWSVLSQANNPARLVTLVDPGTMASSTLGCDQAVTALNSQLNTDAGNTLTAEAGRFFPGLAQVTANASLSSALQTTDQYQMGLSWAATDAIKQAQLANAVMDAQYLIPAQLGDAATSAVNLDTARAVRSTNQSYALMAKLASSTMPKVRNIIELTLYAVFPLVVLIIVAAGHFGGMAFRGYVTSLIWVQLWPPLYAVMHYVMTLHSQELATATQGLGASLSQYAFVNDAIVTDQAIAGFMSATAVPGLAWALAQGMISGAQGMVSAMSTSTAGSRDVEKIGSAGGLGNRQSGSFSENTANFDNASGHQYNTAPTMRHGAPVRTEIGTNGVNTTTFADGTTAVDASRLQHKMNVRMNAGSRVAQSLQQQSEAAEAAAVGEMVSAASATAASLQQSSDFVRTHGKGERAGSHYGDGDQTGFTQAVSQTQKIVDGFKETNGLSQKQAAELLAYAEASAGVGLGPVQAKAAARITGKSEAAATQLLEKARNYAKEKGYSEAVDKVRRTSKDASFDASDDSGRKAMAGIRASLDESRQHLDQASANNTRSLSFKEAVTRARENSGTWEAGLNRQFVDWMGTQDDRFNGRNFTPQTIAWIAEHDPMALEPFKDKFFQEQVEPRLNAGVGDLKTQEDIRQFFAKGKATVPSVTEVRGQGNQWLGNVGAAAARAGVNPKAIVTSELPGRVEEEQKRAAEQIAADKAKVEARGVPLAASATKGTDPTRQNLLGNASANAAAKVLPAGTSYLLNKAGAIPDAASIARTVAENYKGDTTTAIVDTVIFAGGVVVGGVGGKVVGGIVGKAAGAMVGEGAAQATLPGIVSATEVSVTEVTGTIGGAVGAGATGLALDGKSGDGTPLMARAQSAVTPAHVSWSDVRNWNGTIRQGVGDALPKPVNEALEGALNYGEQKVGKAIGTPSPRRDAGEPASQARQADGKDAEDATKGNASPRGSR